jgi:type 2 lantibiotic biosynthesis protein LanM
VGKKPPSPQPNLIVNRSLESAPIQASTRSQKGAATSHGKRVTRIVVDTFYQRLSSRAATLDELLSGAFDTSISAPGDAPKSDPDLAARRLGAWRQSSAAGDSALFTRRLARDNLSPACIERRLAAAQRDAAAPYPRWVDDSIWIEAALQSESKSGVTPAYPFEDLFVALVERAEAFAWSDLAVHVSSKFHCTARASLRNALLAAVSELCAPALYERFAKMRNEPDSQSGKPSRGHEATAIYCEFIATMRSGGFRILFEDKPVLLRLIAILTRQWIDVTREFVIRLAADLPAICHDLIPDSPVDQVVDVVSDISDPHNDGRCVLIVHFAGGARIVYKPKDVRIDLAWCGLVERLNGAGAPVTLKTARSLARDSYGWTEYIEHTGCADLRGCEIFFRRAGAWLALLHCFAATDMHQENLIAAGDHPVPIDLETILQPSPEEHKVREPEAAAFDAAMDIIGNSVMTVGLLPAYGRSVDNNVFAMGGMTADWGARIVVKWNNLNSDAMRPAKVEEPSASTPNLPHVDGRYAKLTDHSESFVAGFTDYAHFLARQVRDGNVPALLESFAGLLVRKVVRPTRFYYMLLRRLKNHRSMTDGIVWSAQADFMARLADWDKENDPLWPLQKAERAALTLLNVPYFVTPSDDTTIRDLYGTSVQTTAIPGLERARARLEAFDQTEIAWQVEVIRQNIAKPPQATPHPADDESVNASTRAINDKAGFKAEAGKIAAELARHAIRRDSSAAWIGLDWLGDSDVAQLVCLGPDLYNGASGIAVFLGAHAALTADEGSAQLAHAALAHIRRNLNSRNAPRFARSLGIGAATGLGSVVYALAVTAKCLDDHRLRGDAERAAQLFTDELIAADKQLDVMGGAAGAVLTLLRLYRDTQSDDVLGRAIRCGEHLLLQDRLGPEGRRSWIGQGFGGSPLNGMSHGAAGFAYALASLAAASRRDEFAAAAAECIGFEDASYDAEHHNWPDLRGGSQFQWPCQWCHGAPGIGLARLATARRIASHAELQVGLDAAHLNDDIAKAVEGVKRARPAQLDTLCCGTLGGVEFLCEAADRVSGREIGELALQRLTAVLDRSAASGDYRWNSGNRRFNLGLFRGLAGVGYTILRRLDPSLPNVLIWE